MERERQLFKEYLKKTNFKITQQRLEVLEVFLQTERHISCDELYQIVRNKDPRIGYATVYRTLRLIRDAGLAREADLGDKVLRLEHEYDHKHHDHLICIKCGKFLEVFDSEIESLQERLAKTHRFKPIRHKMEIFGYCVRCR